MTAGAHLLSGKRRIVIKIGSSLLVDPRSGLKGEWLASLGADVAELARDGAKVLLVSSGAIALGRTILDLPPRALKLDESQAAAAAGQIELARAWSEALAAHDLVAGQILLTLNDTEGGAGRRSYLNARDTIERLLSFGAVPLINENDTVATSEIRYGDNDRLAARVASMVKADVLVLLSDIDGLYTAPPGQAGDARFVPHVPRIDATIEAMAGSAGSALSRGGMVTKIEAGKIATRAGCAMVIASGKRDHPVNAIRHGSTCTWFDATGPTNRARKTWIAGQLAPKGTLTLDAGAMRALSAGKSLLPAGVTRVDGQFRRGEPVAICAADGKILAHGIVSYDADEARAIMGLRSEQWEDALGYEGRSVLVHRDDMALIGTPADEADRVEATRRAVADAQEG